ncbi:MAG TPA: tRNA (adenosine(37)-N6)-dimethylallyltransferase MiaA [Pseudolabrys sp.]|nr:tRNA (adenosine(37)-N6)-dimethylallyltransferase MiaA [Pseudolabrys sp.]
MHSKCRCVLIAGPTGSGKSALALELAGRVRGAVINADSMQVYRDLRVLTARPTLHEEARVPHRLYGFVDAAENYSVGRWRRDIETILAEVTGQGLMPIIVGGTGLYFKVLTAGLAAVPPIPPDIRARVRESLEAEGPVAMHRELGRLDPETAQRIRPNDRSRISRALEVVLATGRPLAQWHLEGLPPLIGANESRKFFITCDRTQLVQRIELRFEAMLNANALQEVSELAARKLDPALPVMKAHGVPWLIRHVKGEISLSDAQAGVVMDTRRYAKRQITWFRNQMEGWKWVESQRALDVILAELQSE